MKTKMTATIAIAVVAMMVFAAAGATTFSWFTDTEETDITITTGSLDVETKGFYVNTDGNELTDGDVLPDNISIIYDDGRSATDVWKDVNTISIAGNPDDANIEIGYEVTFTADIDYKYLIDVVVPEQIHVDVTVIKKGDVSKTNIGYGLWKFPAVEPSEEFSATYDVKIVIESIPMGLVDANIKIVNKITQYLDTNEHPIDTWNGVVPDSMPESLIVDKVNHLISINDADAFAYLNTLVNDSGFYDEYGSKWKYSIELNANINLNNEEWTPIILSNFVKFDGKGHSIYNLNVKIEGDSAGLFGVVSCNDIGVTYVKNFNLINAKVVGNHNVGAVIGSSTQGAVSNVVVENADLTGMKYVGGIFGWGNGSVNDCTVMNSSITIPEDGIKEAGGLIGYLSNDGKPITTNKVISGNHLENVSIYAPTVASGLVSQPNSCNAGGAVIEIIDNSMVNVSINTEDDTCDYFVSEDVTGKTIVENNSCVKCNVNGNVYVVTDPANLKNNIKDNATIVLSAGEYSIPSLKENVGISIIGTEGTVIGGEDVVTGFGSNFGKDTTIKNMIFNGSTNGVRYSSAQGGTSTFDNCRFEGGSTYGFHIDESKGATFIFNNCTFVGFNAFAGDLEKVTFNNCTFLSNGYYGHTNIWSVGEFNDCVWGDNSSVGIRGSGKLYFNGVEESYLHEFIGSKESLFNFAKSVNEGGDAWTNQKVLLVADIDLNNEVWTPIGQTGATEFKGIFDGQGYKISNLAIDSSLETGGYYSSALFGWLEGHSSNAIAIKNVTVDTASVVGHHNCAVIVGYATGNVTVSNCHVVNASVSCTNVNNEANGDKAGIIVGNGTSECESIDNCSAKDSSVSAGRDAGQIVGACKSGLVINCKAENVTVSDNGTGTGANIRNEVIGRLL